MKGCIKVQLAFLLVVVAAVIFLHYQIFSESVSAAGFLVAIIIVMVLIVIGTSDIEKEGIKQGRNRYEGKIISRYRLNNDFRHPVNWFYVGNSEIVIGTQGRINCLDSNAGAIVIGMSIEDIPKRPGKQILEKGDEFAFDSNGKLYFLKPIGGFTVE